MVRNGLAWGEGRGSENYQLAIEIVQAGEKERWWWKWIVRMWEAGLGDGRMHGDACRTDTGQGSPHHLTEPTGCEYPSRRAVHTPAPTRCLNSLVNYLGFGNPVKDSPGFKNTSASNHTPSVQWCSLPSDSWMFSAVRKVSCRLKWNLSLRSHHPISPILPLGTRQKGCDAYFIRPTIRNLMTILMSSQTLFISRLYSNNGHNVNVYCAFPVPGIVLRASHMPSPGLNHK